MFFFHWWVQPIVRQFPSSLQSTVAASPSTVNCETIPAANSQLPVVIGDIQVVPRKCLLIFRRSSEPWKMKTKINTKSILFQMCGGWGGGGHAMLLLLTTSLKELFPIKTNGQRIKGRTDRRMERHIWKTASHCPSWGQCHQLYCTLDKSSSIYLLLVRKMGASWCFSLFSMWNSLSSKKNWVLLRFLFTILFWQTSAVLWDSGQELKF